MLRVCAFCYVDWYIKGNCYIITTITMNSGCYFLLFTVFFFFLLGIRFYHVYHKFNKKKWTIKIFLVYFYIHLCGNIEIYERKKLNFFFKIGNFVTSFIVHFLWKLYSFVSTKRKIDSIQNYKKCVRG